MVSLRRNVHHRASNTAKTQSTKQQQPQESQRHVQQQPKSCWACGTDLTHRDLLCPAMQCLRVQPIDEAVTTYFDVLNEYG